MMEAILDRFIVIEGLDGSGTTTQMKLLVEAFDTMHISCHAAFEPTSSPIGTLVRDVLQKKTVTTPLALAMLFAADREDHLNHPLTGIIERLASGTIVVCDRYKYSSLAYQSVECGFDRVQELNMFPDPRFVFFIDTPIDDCLKRIDIRSNERELFERQEFLAQVRDNYELIFSRLDEKVVFTRIDGTLDRLDIHKRIVAVLNSYSIL